MKKEESPPKYVFKVTTAMGEELKKALNGDRYRMQVAPSRAGIVSIYIKDKIEGSDVPAKSANYYSERINTLSATVIKRDREIKHLQKTIEDLRENLQAAINARVPNTELDAEVDLLRRTNISLTAQCAAQADGLREKNLRLAALQAPKSAKQNSGTVGRLVERPGNERTQTFSNCEIQNLTIHTDGGRNDGK